MRAKSCPLNPTLQPTRVCSSACLPGDFLTRLHATGMLLHVCPILLGGCRHCQRDVCLAGSLFPDWGTPCSLRFHGGSGLPLLSAFRRESLTHGFPGSGGRRGKNRGIWIWNRAKGEVKRVERLIENTQFLWHWVSGLISGSSPRET